MLNYIISVTQKEIIKNTLIYHIKLYEKFSGLEK